MIVLGIETSCDETSAAVLKNGRQILSNIVASQEKIHKQYFGVVPELASRAHVENINWVVKNALKGAGIARNPGLIAFTSGPGLMGSLIVGQVVAQVLSYIYDIPLIEVNHLEGHIFSAILEYPELKPPFLSLIISGGHTELIIVEKIGVYKVLGQTRDDACGEAFDKVAKLLMLGYPGGPEVEKNARKGNAQKVNFPRPYMRGSWDFSFSGLKTAVLYYLKKHPLKRSPHLSGVRRSDICASFQQAVIDTLLGKIVACVKEFGLKKVAVVGGVAANSALRDSFGKAASKSHIKFYFPSKKFCTDNAAMIAYAGYHKFRKRGQMPFSYRRSINTRLPLQSW
jgi:N6-L-threonylcarbamoyladenine synthase